MFFVYHSWSTWGLEMLVYFEEKGKLEYPAKKPLRAKERTNNKLNLQMAFTPDHIGGGWVLSPLCHPSGAIIAKPHLDNNNNNNNFISIALLSYVQGALQSCKQHYWKIFTNLRPYPNILDALCSIFILTSFSHLATPCCVGHRHDVGWKCCVVFAGLYECCTVQYRSACTL